MQVDIELAGFVDVVADAIEDDGFEEELGDGGIGGDEDAGGFVAGVRGPRFRMSEVEQILPLREGREDFEWLGEFARAVAGKDLTDSSREGRNEPGFALERIEGCTTYFVYTSMTLG